MLHNIPHDLIILSSAFSHLLNTCLNMMMKKGNCYNYTLSLLNFSTAKATKCFQLYLNCIFLLYCAIVKYYLK